MRNTTHIATENWLIVLVVGRFTSLTVAGNRLESAASVAITAKSNLHQRQLRIPNEVAKAETDDVTMIIVTLMRLR